MIVHEVDHGIGTEWPLKQFERSLIKEYLGPLRQSTDKTVLINSTWYSQYHHAQTLRWLRNNKWNDIVLVAMVDAAIPEPSWFSEFNRPVTCVGNYKGNNELVFWSLVVDRWLQTSDSKSDPSNIDLPYMCLNRKPHWHRMRLYQTLQAESLLDRGLVSMGSKNTEAPLRVIPEEIADNDLAPNGTRYHHGIPNDIVSLGSVHNWNRCFLNVVTETTWAIDDSWFVSEKIFKPIAGHRPFLVYDPTGASGWLSYHGFQDYTRDFSDLTDLDLSVAENIVPFLKILCQQPATYLRSKFVDLSEKISYNAERLRVLIMEQKTKITKGIQCQI